MFWAVSRRFRPWSCCCWRRRGNDVGAQPLGGHVKGHPRAGAGFEEEIDDGFAAQGGDFFTLRERVRLKATAVAWIWSISVRESSSRVMRCLRVQGMKGGRNDQGLRINRS